MHHNTGLTPGFGSLSILKTTEMKEHRDKIRATAKHYIQSGLFDHAVVFLKQLVGLDASALEDYELLAQAYFHAGEYRRSLGILEQQEMLSLNEVQHIMTWIDHHNNNNVNNNHHNRNNNISSSETSSMIIQKLLRFLLASQCLFKLEKYDDCLGLLEAFITLDESIYSNYHHPIFHLHDHHRINATSSIMYMAGKCYDIIDNKVESKRFLVRAMIIDPTCLHAIDYMLEKKLISRKERRELYEQLPMMKGELAYLDSYYRNLLLQEDDDSHRISMSTLLNMKSVHTIISQAELCYDQHASEDACKLARRAFHLDHTDQRGLVIYIAAAVDLNLASELYYISHELTSSSPKLAISWYAVGCYYYCTRKYELCQKYLTKASKLDRRFIYAYIALGHCLSAQQESEHAVSAYRSAVRLAPGEHMPLLCMARELTLMNNFPMALHLLQTASQKHSRDAQILNEIGVILLRLDRVEESLQYFHEAVNRIEERMSADQSSNIAHTSKGCAIEILCNYGLALRRCEDYPKALQCYSAALSFDPQDPDIHLSLGFLHHVMRRFDDAITHYHATLAFRPNTPLAIDMLQKGLSDKETYLSINPAWSS